MAAVDVSFEVPNERWQGSLEKLTLNCYLYNIRENKELRTQEPIFQRTDSGKIRRKAPARIDCSYCITAWSGADDDSAKEEHNLLSQVLEVLFRYPTIPSECLQGELIDQIPPHPTSAAGVDGVKNQPEFWGALDQPVKPSITYIVTLAMMLDDLPPEPPATVLDYDISVAPRPTPPLIKAVPTSVQQGETVQVRVLGFYTHFSDQSEIGFSPSEGTSIDNVIVENQEELTFDISIEDDAPLGGRTLRIVTGSEEVIKKDGIEISSAT